MDDKIKLLRDLVMDSENIVFFGGAGVSTESGIPDFRSKNGLYNMEYKYPPETILSSTFFMLHPDEFYRFYREKLIFRDAKPNPAHRTLAKLEEMGKLKAVITQNVDGLHSQAGSQTVIELHGSVHRNYCMDCGMSYSLESIMDGVKSASGEALLPPDGITRCTCGGIVKPEVTLFGEQLSQDVIEKAIKYISEADMLIVGGTSLNVYPAAAFIDYYEGNRLVLINMSRTTHNLIANLAIRGKIGEVLPLVVPMECGKVSPEDEQPLLARTQA